MTTLPGTRDVADVLNVHRDAGTTFRAGGVNSFVRQDGDGKTVVFVHGMWGASFLYRKVLPELAALGVRGVSFDLPGFGFADRPTAYDYTWTGLGAFVTAAVDALKLDEFHLVVHDIGGPVGFEMAARRPQQIRSLTILNTMIDVTVFNPPRSMRPFRHRWVGDVWLRSLHPRAFRTLMRLQGVSDMTAVTPTELDAHLVLMRLGDSGRAFLRAMRGAERTEEKQQLYRSVVGSHRYPVQVVWARDDPALPLRSYGARAVNATGATLVTIPGKHFPQEDHAHDVAANIARFVSAHSRGSRT